ncbi:MAG: hypothetical protein MJ007_01875 [Paludibacteraceae bacterium]|nr:hypothetical protein [Paludibacteraceae bacterium]
MKISDYNNEDALDLLVDLIDPVSNLFTDSEFTNAVKTMTKIEAVKIAIKNHKKDIIEILARLDGTPVNKYKCNVITIARDLLEILNDEALLDFFTSQGLMEEKSASSEPMVIIEGQKK